MVTLKDLVKQINPESINPNAVGGVNGCPSNYEYLNSNLKPFNCITLYNCCEDCWNQEFIPKRNSITWEKLWKRIGKQPLFRTQHSKVQVLVNGELKECALVYTNNGTKFHLEPVERSNNYESST